MDELSPRRSRGNLSPGKSPKEVSPQDPLQDKKKPPTNQEIEQNLKESLHSTGEGLKNFLDSMQAAKMPEAVHAYRAMQIVLVQQRLWAEQYCGGRLLQQFQSIAQSAGELHRIFASFAEVMRPLKEIDKLSSPMVTETEQGE